MKRIIAIIAIELMVFSCLVAPCFATTNKQLVKNYCHKHYPNMKVKFFTEWNEDVITHRKGTNIVYVEKCKSISTGKIDKGNNRCYGKLVSNSYYRTWYSKKVKKGKKVTQYFIYNPYSNYDDDVVAVVDNNKVW